MKWIIRTIIFLLTISITGCNSKNDYKLHVVTFNIRLDLARDGVNRWENRVPLVYSYFNEEKPDIIGMQEVLHSQLLDLNDMLTDYDYVGTGRSDGIHGGEYSPIYFRTDRFELINHSQVWLSENPYSAGSIGWDAAYPRVVTWAELKDRKAGKIIYVFNTHFDHRGMEARKESIRLMSETMSTVAEDAPLIAMGDFNIRKNHPDIGNELYSVLIDTFMGSNFLLNSEYISKNPTLSAGATFNGFRENWRDAPPYAIDYIFVNESFDVNEYRIDHVTEGEVFISDHWPVISILSYSD
jgi:endonuclease/exonuclease/phosphatase family metal-dependent hydrolase